MPKACFFCGLAGLVLVSALWARQGDVRLVNGTIVSGDVNDNDPNQVVVTLHGAQEIIQRDNVDSIEYFDGPDDEFTSRLSKLGARDVPGRLDLARWAADERRFDLAKSAVTDALAIDPSSAAAKELMRTIIYRSGLTTGAAEATTRPTATQPAIQRSYLTLDQINLIRQLEMKPDDAFAVTFTHDVRRRYLESGLIDAQQFYNLSPDEQAREILTRGAPALAADVRITGDPASMEFYRRQIQPMLMGGCAISGCHNTVAAAGGFALYGGDVSPQAWYTNFYLIQTHVTPPAEPGAAPRLMIDRTYPEKSLLAEYGLPRKQANSPHPAGAEFRPIFLGRNDERYLTMIRWIGSMLKPDAGSYGGIGYEPPWGRGGGDKVTR
ncbi:MAG: hypothetical protein ABSH22_14425 [Tepidisphaeraceae bacterium]|jgi:hypothetical protein